MPYPIGIREDENTLADRHKYDTFLFCLFFPVDNAAGTLHNKGRDHAGPEAPPHLTLVINSVFPVSCAMTDQTRNNRLALVTGATGFIGRFLCRRLGETGFRVRALTRGAAPASDRPFPWEENVQCELGRELPPDGLMTAVDTVFHLAGVAHSFRPTKEMEPLYWAVNCQATEELLKMAREAGVRCFIYFSSVKAMAEPGEQRVDESWTAYPAGIYGLSKRKAEEAVLAAGESSGMHVCNLRPVLVYGPSVKGNLLRMMEAIEAGRFPPLPDTGNQRSLVHVQDLVQAALLAAESPASRGRTYIVTGGQDYSTHEIQAALYQALGRDMPHWSLPAWLLRSVGCFGDVAGKIFGRKLPVDSETVQRLLGSAAYDSTRIQRELGYTPGFDFPTALPEIVAAYRLASSRASRKD